MANYSLRNLTAVHAKAIEQARARFSLRTDSAAIRRILERFLYADGEVERMAQRLAEAERLIAEYTRATGDAAEAMDREVRGLAALVKFSNAARTDPSKDIAEPTPKRRA